MIINNLDSKLLIINNPVNRDSNAKSLDLTLTREKSMEEKEIVEMIEGMIIFGDYAPGFRLVEDDLMSLTGSKRYAVRKALKQLEEGGLVVIERNKGASVNALSNDEIAKIYEMRFLLQKAAVDLFPFPVDPFFIATLKTIHIEYTEALTEGADARLIDKINDKFHKTFFSYCDNAYLANEITRYGNRVRLIRSQAITDLSMRKLLLADHEAMIEALEKSNREKLKSLCITHMERALTAYRNREQENS